LADQLKAVRDWEKPIPYVEDIVNYNKAEFWATPYEMLAKNGGDTEDFAILGYFALRAAGVSADAMRVFAVRIPALNGIGHSLLAVDTDSGPMILDNRTPLPLAAKLVAKEYMPVIAINENAWWFYLK